MLSDLLFNGVINGLEKVCDVVEFGPLSAISINSSGAPEAERSQRRAAAVMKDNAKRLGLYDSNSDEEEEEGIEENEMCYMDETSKIVADLIADKPRKYAGVFGTAIWVQENLQKQQAAKQKDKEGSNTTLGLPEEKAAVFADADIVDDKVSMRGVTGRV